MNIQELKNKIDAKERTTLENERKQKGEDINKRRVNVQKIESYAPQIEQLLDLANYCLKKDIPLTREIRPLTEEYDLERNFTTNYFCHQVGFYYDYQSNSYRGVGIAAPHNSGHYSLFVDKYGRILERDCYGYTECEVNRFIEEIDDFIERFTKFIENL